MQLPTDEEQNEKLREAIAEMAALAQKRSDEIWGPNAAGHVTMLMMTMLGIAVVQPDPTAALQAMLEGLAAMAPEAAPSLHLVVTTPSVKRDLVPIAAVAAGTENFNARRAAAISKAAYDVCGNNGGEAFIAAVQAVAWLATYGANKNVATPRMLMGVAQKMLEEMASRMAENDKFGVSN